MRLCDIYKYFTKMSLNLVKPTQKQIDELVQNICQKYNLDFEEIVNIFGNKGKEKEKEKSNNLKKNPKRESSVITLTFCDSSENHIGMEQNGNKGVQTDAFDKKDLETIQNKLEKLGVECEMIYLNDYCDKDLIPEKVKNSFEDAFVLVIRNGVNYLLNDKGNTNQLFEELLFKQLDSEWDTKYWDGRRKKVLNKHARANVCISNKSQKPDYENKKGTIICYNDLPLVNKIKNELENLIGEKGKELECEGNLYFDKEKCGIGYHGDAERVKVIGIRIGEMKLCYHWYLNSQPIGKKCEIELKDGDIYLMSYKSVGNDWKKKSIMTLRHSAGCDFYTNIKNK